MQKSRQVSLTPTLQELNWRIDLFSRPDWNSKKQNKKAQILTPPTQLASSSSADVKYCQFGFLFI